MDKETIKSKYGDRIIYFMSALITIIRRDGLEPGAFIKLTELVKFYRLDITSSEEAFISNILIKFTECGVLSAEKDALPLRTRPLIMLPDVVATNGFMYFYFPYHLLR